MGPPPVPLDAHRAITIIVMYALSVQLIVISALLLINVQLALMVILFTMVHVLMNAQKIYTFLWHLEILSVRHVNLLVPHA